MVQTANVVEIAQAIRILVHFGIYTSLWGVYILTFVQIVVKFSVFWVLYPYCCTDGDEIWHSSVPNFTQSVQHVAVAKRKTSKLRSE